MPRFFFDVGSILIIKSRSLSRIRIALSLSPLSERAVATSPRLSGCKGQRPFALTHCPQSPHIPMLPL
ncbi:MAG: hypothetical protein AAF609_20865 [Cyanobacteria bacterium P01_C01_bin.120]